MLRLAACVSSSLKVDCKAGDTLQDALDQVARIKGRGEWPAGPLQVDISGICQLQQPLRLNKSVSGPSSSRPLVLQGNGFDTALSGGVGIRDWKPVSSWPSAPHGGVVVANMTDFALKEIKMLRVGSEMARRSRYPKQVGHGLSTPNWLFAAPWSKSTMLPDGHVQLLGLDPASLPNTTTAQELVKGLVGAFAHVLGCVENDVNSQLTKVLAVSEEATDEPLLSVYFRNKFNVHQRFYLENVPWALAPGEFYHDERQDLLYLWPDANMKGQMSISGSVVSPVTDTLLEIEHATNINISNLTFTDTTYYADGYWDGPAQQPSDAAVRIQYSRGVHISGCHFVAGLGGYGVAVGNSSTHCSVQHSLFDRVGQGGVILYGFDSTGPRPANPGRAVGVGNNSQPTRILVAHNVMQDLGQVLVHVAGVALRSASHCTVAHNRVSRCPRYALQADSFYTVQNSRFNVFEYNVLTDTNLLTTDTGAIEMLGSGPPQTCANGSAPWWTANTIRYNNISATIGSSSSDGKHVCVRGAIEGETGGAGAGCRGLVWGIYLDGGQSGILSHGNVIGAALHGAIFDNAGGNNTHVNNVFIGYHGPGGFDSRSRSRSRSSGSGGSSGSSSSSSSSSSIGGGAYPTVYSSALMDFGTAGGPANKNPDGSIPDRSVAGSVVKRNVFYWVDVNAGQIGSSSSGVGGARARGNGNGSMDAQSQSLPPMAMMASQVPWSNQELKVNGSDYNLFWTWPGSQQSQSKSQSQQSQAELLTSAPVFPGGKNFSTWQGCAHANGSHELPVKCGDPQSDLIVSAHVGDWGYLWEHNLTDSTLRAVPAPAPAPAPTDGARAWAGGREKGSNLGWCLNIDCDGDWSNCARGTVDTHLCMSKAKNPWNPHPPPPVVDNQAWTLNDTGTYTKIIAMASQKCVEVCDRGGGVHGCDGGEGSRIQLSTCTGAKNQMWMWNSSYTTDTTTANLASGSLCSQLNGLCIRSPPDPAPEANDMHSLIADPMFVDPENGDFNLKPDSPLHQLGFEPIPLIDAPEAVCGGGGKWDHGGGREGSGRIGCLSLVFDKQAVST